MLTVEAWEAIRRKVLVEGCSQRGAAQELGHFRRVTVSRPTAQRLSEAAGAAYVAAQTAEVVRLERELPAPPPGPAQQFLSVDGAMVPLVGGEWAEVKTLVLGEVQPVVIEHGEPVPDGHRRGQVALGDEADPRCVDGVPGGQHDVIHFDGGPRIE